MIQTIPMIFYLGLCYLYLVDARNHYVTQDGSLSEFILTTYITLARTEVALWFTTVDGWLVTLYGWTYSLVFVYLNPVMWLQ
jgi:hypothetical protein